MESVDLEEKPQNQAESGEITRLLGEVAASTPGAIEDLFGLVRDDLRRRAELKLAGSPRWRTMDPTALMHEMYLRLFGRDPAPSWENRRHFFMVASRAMHDVLVERARRATSGRAGGGLKRKPLDGEIAAMQEAKRFLALHHELSRLAEHKPRHADIVRMRFFAGMSTSEIARTLDLSDRTVKREWAAARAWLNSQLGGDHQYLR